MKKLFCFSLVASVLFVVNAWTAGTYSGGNGSEANPYRISTPADMNEIGANSDDWDKHFLLVNDIDLAQFTGTQFNIIGNESSAFTGVFDGNNHTISNFTYDSPGMHDVGLFGFTNGTGMTIKNLGLINPYVRGDNCVGALAGRMYGTVSNCFVEGGTISGAAAIGGLIGSVIFDDSVINKCYSTAAVNCSVYYAGGLIGVSAGDFTINNSYAAGTVTGVDYVGGLLGSSTGSAVTINNSYAIGAVTGNDYVGGLVGETFCDPRKDGISNCYAAGAVSGSGSYVGGFAGAAWGPVTNNYWDIQASGQQNSIGGQGKTTAQMKTEDTFVGWDFIETWDIGEKQTYPYLRAYPNGDNNHDRIVNLQDLAIFANHWLKDLE